MHKFQPHDPNNPAPEGWNAADYSIAQYFFGPEYERLLGPNNAGDTFDSIRPRGAKIRGGFRSGEIVNYGRRSGMSQKSNFTAMQIMYDYLADIAVPRPLPDPHVTSSVMYTALEGFDV